MSNILQQFLGEALDMFIISIAKSVKEQNKIREEEKKHKELKDGSIDVEFEVKTDKITK